MNDIVPLLDAAQFLLGVTQHLVQSAVREMFSPLNVVDSNANLGVLENGAEKLVGALRGAVGLFVPHGSLSFLVCRVLRSKSAAARANERILIRSSGQAKG